MAKPSKSGLFEVWGGFLIEGDCVTPSRIHMFLVETFPTSEALAAASDCDPKVDRFSGLDFCEVRPPAAYQARHNKLAAIKQARRDAESTEVPF